MNLKLDLYNTENKPIFFMNLKDIEKYKSTKPDIQYLSGNNANFRR